MIFPQQISGFVHPTLCLLKISNMNVQLTKLLLGAIMEGVRISEQRFSGEKNLADIFEKYDQMNDGGEDDENEGGKA